ncbi:fructose-2,6-bisphosphatase [Rivularia sp. PCC 7116]|uniref:histidine phosphatase family protein n=1 Tax=Rivularia sp. PCC 7116 TaxID=373994 RepID=UPI00029ED813|nr:phosphoglycerate mutase family protein [Rivularia sp. PCC 7116]AFY57737.1 fructose-2,6-bisphosphatase [Rivularia sp. PCC 7116]
MPIYLVRHGKPTVSTKEKVQGNQFLDFIKCYDAAGIASDSVPPENLIDIIQKANVIFTSNLSRTIDSARILQPQVKPISNSIFREINCWRNFSTSAKLSALGWAVISRLLWEFKISPIVEPPVATRRRAKQAAELLIQEYQGHGSVVLIAHGGINTFIAKELRLLGWQGSRNLNNQHWGCTEYSLKAELTQLS